MKTLYSCWVRENDPDTLWLTTSTKRDTVVIGADTPANPCWASGILLLDHDSDDVPRIDDAVRRLATAR